MHCYCVTHPSNPLQILIRFSDYPSIVKILSLKRWVTLIFKERQNHDQFLLEFWSATPKYKLKITHRRISHCDSALRQLSLMNTLNT